MFVYFQIYIHIYVRVSLVCVSGRVAGGGGGAGCVITWVPFYAMKLKCVICYLPKPSTLY